MRTPISHALAWPQRLEAGVEKLNLFDIAQLNFEKPDPQRFPCLGLARRAFAAGGTGTTLLNAANEVAVDEFLHGRIRFTDIAGVVAQTLDEVDIGPADTLELILEADRQARLQAQAQCRRLA